MARPPDGTAPGWDALAPASGSDALAVAAADALSATSLVASADALAVGYRTDALAVGDRTDALAAGDAPATGDLPAAPVLGDTFGDSLTAYGDATAADRPDTRRAPGRRTPRPGPVPPAAAATDERSPGDRARGRAAGRAARTGPADAGRQPRRGAPTPGPRRAGGTGYSAAGSGRSRTGQPGSGSGGPVPTSPRWANRTSRPTGTVPWAGPSARSGWDDLIAGTGGTAGSGKQPSGAEVARALLEAFRRSLRDR